MRLLSFICTGFGFLVLALGVAQSLKIVPASQPSAQPMEVAGVILMIIGIAFANVAGLKAVSPGPTMSPNGPVTKTVTTVQLFKSELTGVNPASGVGPLIGTVEAELLKGLLERLNDPAQASKIQIVGGDTEQAKEQLRNLLSPTAPPASVASDSQSPDGMDARSKQLRELADLRAAGVLTDDQYQTVRAKLLE